MARSSTCSEVALELQMSLLPPPDGVITGVLSPPGYGKQSLPRKKHRSQMEEKWRPAKVQMVST